MRSRLLLRDTHDKCIGEVLVHYDAAMRELIEQDFVGRRVLGYVVFGRVFERLDFQERLRFLPYRTQRRADLLGKPTT